MSSEFFKHKENAMVNERTKKLLKLKRHLRLKIIYKYTVS